MSQENVELVRKWVAAVNGNDLAMMLALADPELDYMSYNAIVAGHDGAYRGHDGVKDFSRDLKETWSWFRIEVDEFRDLGVNVLMVGRLRAQGRSSGLDVTRDMAWIHAFRQGTGPGRYVRLRFYPTAADALEAVHGLPE